MSDGLADPVAGVVDDDRQIGEGGLGAGDHEEVGERGGRDAVAGGHVRLKTAGEVGVLGVAQVDFGEGASYGVEADLVVWVSY